MRQCGVEVGEDGRASLGSEGRELTTRGLVGAGSGGDALATHDVYEEAESRWEVVGSQDGNSVAPSSGGSGRGAQSPGATSSLQPWQTRSNRLLRSFEEYFG